MSQERLANRSGVSQSMISRFERGLAPAMGVRHLIAMANALGRIFPFGTCPHEHECGWQPYRPPDVQTSFVERWLETMLASEAKSTSRDPIPDDDFEISVTLADLSVTSVDGQPE
jgi:transcriptional regulator with XRE-family HTH domain